VTEAVHQFVASLVAHDAVGAHTLAVQGLLRDLGYRSEIYVQSAAPALRARTEPYLRFGRDHPESDSGAVLLYQASTGARMAEFLVRRPERTLVNYHNITPPRFFEPWSPRIGVELRAGLRQVADLGERGAAGLAVSRFNEADLAAMGYGTTDVVPVLVDLDALVGDVDGAAFDRLQRGKRSVDLLFVGRLVPHKCQHDLVKVLAWFRRVYDGDARLHLVGGFGPRTYVEAVRRLAVEAGVADAVSITGPVSPGELAAHYRSADAFVCLSEHEGFCIPLLEAWHHGLPVVAFAAGAVPETLGDAGLLLDDKRPSVVSAAVAAVTIDSDTALAATLAEAGRARLGDYSLERSRARFAEALGARVGAAA